ncbi:hypothetical protein Nstercoris_01724 [Nitrosomonas stercoris]|uniref:Ice-binding protein C-terminal domain-containing protein n=1 Tax=Nitrosomonas stercoris TaxID=1444684 RepID=A0A4Y1YNR7_9PROT|nr:hypothetical protein Nstercoris_01724 [Nitrosomonas stercoris]
MQVGGTFLARGDAGYPNRDYSFDWSGQYGHNGAAGYGGAPGKDVSAEDGADGGYGGRGGLGGHGGYGGSGGTGGDGAGGTIKLAGTTIATVGSDAPRVDASGGNDTEATQGRFILSQGSNGSASFNVQGANVENFDGPQIHNPYIYVPDSLADFAPSDTSMNGDFRFDTAPMIGLTTGPDTFGIVAGLSAQDVMFDALRNQAPDGALAALLRVENLPGHPDLLGTDQILLLNLTDDLLNDLAVGATLASFNAPVIPLQLMLGGYEHNPLFLATAAPTFLNGLTPDQIFAFTVPDDIELRYTLSVGSLGSNNGILSTAGAGAIYLTAETTRAVPEPDTVALLLLGLFGMTARRRAPCTRMA